tara:strand:+ start:8421 stop:9323 length:903 start_codon:yes stop_codon:yes gene_type:complete
MNIINNLIIKSLPLIPKILIKVFSKKYVAGITNQEALSVIKKINFNQQSATIDILGEHTSTNQEADEITNNYLQLLDEIKKNDLNCNLSIKPSHIGADISYPTVLKNFINITEKAKKLNNFIRIDMENSDMTDMTINLYNDLNKTFSNIGIVFQAYLYRTNKDIAKLKNGSNIRLCKGIYNESDKISYNNYNQINENFLNLLKIAFEKDIYVGIATHDKKLISAIINLIEKMNLSNNKFEFQYLHGVPMDDMIMDYKNRGFKTRAYVPFGQNWYDYSIRRIKENPKIASYVLKNVFTKIR